ncbi:dihydroxyacetone kinase subunit DhaL [Brachybacterium huguangmaarense]|uniref:Dihydroxyacetone kinase subunit DhaL n=1 Tax=Brachybacterium huguangmaarense TaxID=1652028 RepID=A0ABY6G305_9MICO|nr:dihydroxyacetone kinase subunit DhaL [Brachybacterium huguangmaarense]UYG17487.1 dihydroxyacetone kinase subunit DhaL [Brachybacterium huguangmaarense]
MTSTDTSDSTADDRGGTVSIADLVAWLERASELLTEHVTELNDLDSAIGDGDHGTNMKRGFAAVSEALGSGEFGTVDELMKKVGSTLVSRVGGASGPLYGTFFLRLGTSQKGATELDAYSLQSAMQAGVEGIEQRGKSMIGQKTMLDAWVPALDAFQRAADSLPLAVQAGAGAAAQGRDDTAPLEAKKGRASYLGERSIGHIDPGAASTALLWQAAVETIGTGGSGGTDSSRAEGYDLAADEEATS